MEAGAGRGWGAVPRSGENSGLPTAVRSDCSRALSNSSGLEGCVFAERTGAPSRLKRSQGFECSHEHCDCHSSQDHQARL